MVSAFRRQGAYGLGNLPMLPVCTMLTGLSKKWNGIYIVYIQDKSYKVTVNS